MENQFEFQFNDKAIKMIIEALSKAQKEAIILSLKEIIIAYLDLRRKERQNGKN